MFYRWQNYALPAVLIISCCGHTLAYDFLEKRSCTLEFPKRADIHTTCVVSGGMQGGTIDVSITTPDGKRYSLEGPIDGEEGHKFLLQKSPASITSEEGSEETCYKRNDERLQLCIGAKVD